MPRTPADGVIFSYVNNVIEDPADRAAALRQAWVLGRSLLGAGSVQVAGRRATPVAFGDGVLTG